MMTSGSSSASHFLEKSKPSNTGFQYGSWDFLLSHAAPMAGTCETLTLATILATLLAYLCPLRLAAIALDRPPAVQHHLRILLLGEPGHGRGHELKGLPVGGEQLGQVVDVAAQLDHAAPVAIQDRLALVIGHRPLAQVLVLVGAELVAVLGLHQRHAELVDVVALPRALRVEQGRARNVIEALRGLAPDAVVVGH